MKGTKAKDMRGRRRREGGEEKNATTEFWQFVTFCSLHTQWRRYTYGVGQKSRNYFLFVFLKFP